MTSSQKIHTTINIIITKKHSIIIISHLTTNATNHQPLLFDRNASHSRPPQAVLSRIFKTVRNPNLYNLARHSCSRHKGHYLQGHLQTSEMLYVHYRKIRNLITQSGSRKSRLQGHLLTSKMLYVQYRRICYFFTQIGPKRICHNTLQETEITWSAANHQHAVCSISHSLQFKHPIRPKQICHLIILLNTETTYSTANFQNVVCSISHNLLLNHPIGPKRICHHSKLLLETETTKSTANFQNLVCSISHNLLLNHPIGPKRICHHTLLMDIEPATFQNAVCSISQNLLLIHPIGPKRIAITYYCWRPRLLDTPARIFKEGTRDADESETETLSFPIYSAGPDERGDGDYGDGDYGDGDYGDGDYGDGDYGDGDYGDGGNGDGGNGDDNAVCLISHNLLLYHPIGPKRICHHIILRGIKPATTFQNVVCSILQNLLLIHPIGPRRIAITYYCWRPRLLDTLANIQFHKPETPTIQRQDIHVINSDLLESL